MEWRWQNNSSASIEFLFVRDSAKLGGILHCVESIGGILVATCIFHNKSLLGKNGERLPIIYKKVLP